MDKNETSTDNTATLHLLQPGEAVGEPRHLLAVMAGEAVDPEVGAPNSTGASLASAMLEHVRRYLVLREEQLVAVVLWVFFAHAHDCFTTSPLLAVTSATMREGKTRLLEVVQGLVPNPLSASNSTPAGIFRAIEREKVTLAVDEAETFVQRNPELRGILNSSFNRGSAYVLRADGRHSTWAPIAIALIGELPPTLKDRGIGIRTRRKLPSEAVEFLRLDEPRFAELKAGAAAWAARKSEALSDAEPEVPKGLNDRQADAWRPLLAIADLLGGHWPRSAREAAVAISKESFTTEDEDLLPAFISDVEQVFVDKNVGRIATRELVQALLALPERPWVTANQGGPINERYVASVLRRFGVKPAEWQVGPRGHRQHQRGYVEMDLSPIFIRYSSGTPGTPGTQP